MEKKSKGVGNQRKRNSPRSASADDGPHAEPRVGIFWLVNGQLILKSAPLSEVTTRVGFKDLDLNHIDYWEELVGLAAVPVESEYDEFPRGRVVFNTRTEQFSVMLDRCILRRRALVRELFRELRLPKDTTSLEIKEDLQYRCPVCLAGNRRKQCPQE